MTISPTEWERLRAGEVVQRAPGRDSSAGDVPLGLVVLPVPIASAWELIAQWERIQEVLPALSFYIARESVDDAGVKHTLAVAELRMPLLAMHLTCRAAFNPSIWHQSWSLVPADELALLIRELPALPGHSRLLREATGSMQLVPCHEGCLLVYRNRIVLHKGLPRALETALTKQLVQQFLNGLRRRLRESAKGDPRSAIAPDLSLSARLERHSTP